MEVQMSDMALALGTLVVAYGSQIVLIKRLVSFIKEISGWKDNAVRLTSFVIGLVLGAFFLWPWLEINPDLPTSFQVVVAVLFLITTGLVTSGDYDLAEEKQGG